jgi:riboflavin kinase / FMN adenylyltransferase
MLIVRGLELYPSDGRPAVVALGVFDGVHLGHQAILDAAVSRARKADARPVACTFDPHPREVLQPGRVTPPITTLDERLALIGQTGIETAIVLRFTAELAAMEPEAFVADVLLGRLRAREVVVGVNHRFGKGARGDAALLQALGRDLGFSAHIVDPLSIGGVVVSSTAVRGALERGDVAGAARLLGRPYTVAGEIVQGAGRGRGIGFPTANLKLESPLLVPTGVYACRARLGGARHPAVTNVGVRPTFGENALAVEVHVLDFSSDLYGQHMTLEFHEHLRQERRFDSIEALKAQIALDVASARQHL